MAMNDEILSVTRDQIQRKKLILMKTEQLSFTLVPCLEDGHAGSKHLGE